MIARIWHGKTSASNFEAYTEFLKQVAIPDYKQTPGFIGLSFLRQAKNDEGHFNLITYWENLDAIKDFAGNDFEKAKYYPEDDGFLLEFEENVQHFEVFSTVKNCNQSIKNKYSFTRVLFVLFAFPQ